MVSVGYMHRYQQGFLYHRIKVITKGDQERFLLSHVFKDFPAICQSTSVVELSVNHYLDGFGSMSYLTFKDQRVFALHKRKALLLLLLVNGIFLFFHV